MNAIKNLSTALLIIAFFTTGYSQELNKVKLDSFLNRLSEKNKAMGSLSIAKDGNTIYSRSIGFSQITGSEKRLSTSETKYRIGSITKMFTATMIFQLIEEGKLKLTDPLNKFFPQVQNSTKITISHMLGHRSGIHDLTDDKLFKTWKMNPKTKDEMLAIITKDSADFEPDAKYSYSNSNYLLLGYIIEIITGKPYQVELQKRITSKIGLKDTYLGSGYSDTNKRESFSYAFGIEWKQETETHLSIPGGAGAIISTSSDLCKFIQSLFDMKLVSQESLNQMRENKMGMMTYPQDIGILYGHGGGIDGFSALLVYLPEEKLAVAYTSNGKAYPITDILDGVFDIYKNKPFTIPAFESVIISSEALDKYIGVYSRPEAPVKFTITRKETTLFAEITGKPAVALEATAQDKFKIESAGIVVEFLPEKEQMIIKRNGGERVFTKEN